MQKAGAVAALGQRRLLLPAWVKAALAANDRLKGGLTALQAAMDQARHPQTAATALTTGAARDGGPPDWLITFAAEATLLDDALMLPQLKHLTDSMATDLTLMARPLLDPAAGGKALQEEVDHWHQWLAALPDDRLEPAQLELLINGRHSGPASLHRLVMSMHKQINRLAGTLANEEILGAHVWALLPDDHAPVHAFMQGLERTAGLKFAHPGLDTVATRDGDRLLLQNDIGTNDAHVLVIEVTGCTVTLHYTDLHPRRLQFFQAQLTGLGAQWSSPATQVDADLNRGAAFTAVTGTFACADAAAVASTLEGIGARIVFLIDWNHARKRLQAFVDRPDALAVLEEAAQREVGHCAWLQAGGEQLIYAAMQAIGEGTFRIGDRLCDVIGRVDARAFLGEVLTHACSAARAGLPAALVADQTRMLLTRHVRQHPAAFDLLAEHAAYCQALAQAVSDALTHGVEHAKDEAEALAIRARAWEHKADLLVMQARESATQQPRWQAIARLAGQADDVADALEEAAFVISLIADHHDKGWTSETRNALGQLAAMVLFATEAYVKALAVARTISSAGDTSDNDAFIAATWQVLQGERQCDVLLRRARKVIFGTVQGAAALMLANDLAATLEDASDSLLAAGYALREVTFEHAALIT